MNEWISMENEAPPGLGYFQVLDEEKHAKGVAVYNPTTKLWSILPTEGPKPDRVTHWKEVVICRYIPPSVSVEVGRLPNMFTTHPDDVRVVRCKDCIESYTPVKIPPGAEQPVVTARFCGLTHRLKSDDGYCDEGRRKE